MPDYEHRREAPLNGVNSEMLELTSSVTLAHDMLSLAGAFGREQVIASNMLQLNSMTAMLELVREYGQRSRRPSPVVNEALDLVKQVVAAAQAS